MVGVCSFAEEKECEVLSLSVAARSVFLILLVKVVESRLCVSVLVECGLSVLVHACVRARARARVRVRVCSVRVRCPSVSVDVDVLVPACRVRVCGCMSVCKCMEREGEGLRS